jgi:NAD(P)-dependent dehydrogenase (short-subunit alcohol dehydrogenase family)
MRLAGKHAVITGGAGDIGFATARALLGEGATVVIVDLGNDRVDSAVRRLNHDQAYGISADVTRSEDVRRYCEEAHKLRGGVDIFFNNAGIGGDVAPLTSYSDETFDTVMAVNVRGVYLGLKHMLPRMNNGGSVIITSSIAGLKGTNNIVAYTASKHAVVGIMRTAAQEAAPQGIRVNTIHPGPVEGQLMRTLETGFSPLDPDAGRATITQRLRLGRYIRPDEVAKLVVFLGSDESQMITGATMLIDSGMLL